VRVWRRLCCGVEVREFRLHATPTHRPQRLKPLPYRGKFGTAEAVPLPETVNSGAPP
jgi:hypothetical protein